MIDPELRALLVCPRCRGELTDVQRGKNAVGEAAGGHEVLVDGLLCAACAVVWPVLDGVPYLVEECALPAADVARSEP